MGSFFNTNRTWIRQITPILVIALTVLIALLHFNKSRMYNYQIALVELLILASALIIYGRALIKSIPVKSLQFYLLLGLILAYLMSSLQSDFVKYGMQRSISVGVWIAYFWLIVYLLREKYIKPEHLIIAIATSSLLPILWMLIDYWRMQPIRYSTFLDEHLNAYSNIRHASYHAVASYFFSLYFFVLRRQQAKFMWLLAGCILVAINIYFLIWSGSRQGILLVLLFTPIVLLLYFRPGIKRTLILISILLALSALTLFLSGYSEAIDGIVDRFMTGRGRFKIWEYAVELIQSNYLFGIGPDAFYVIRRPRTWVIQVHNGILQILLEAGVIGCLLFVTSISLLLVKAKQLISNLSRGSHEYQSSLLTFCFLIAYLTNSMVDGIFYHVLPIYMFSMASALLVYQFDRPDELVTTA
jgi:O-antigen ligase